MMNRIGITLTALLLIVYSAGFAQNLSNRGKEFWVGYGHHHFFETGANNQDMVLYLSAEQAAQVTVTINGTSYSQTYNVPANSVIQTSALPKSGANDCRLYSGAPGFTGSLSEGTSDRGIHIVSDVPIVAYAHIYGSASSGATMLMPVETYGYSYVSVNSQQRYGSNNCFSWIYIIAKENNTKVEIVPSVNTRGGHAANSAFTVTLNKGQIYQVLGALITASEGYDLSGTKVRSIANASGECYPIGVFAGSSRTYITCSGTGGSGGDNIIQQIFPFQAWGKRYLTAPTSNSSSPALLMTNLYRVAVKDPATVVKVNGSPLTNLIKNSYYDFQSGSADFIEADQPILVAQYMPSNGSCANTSGDGDPEMMYISPIEQAIKKVGFYRNTRESITENYLTLIIPSDGLNSLTIDGSSTFSYTYDHPNLPGYTVVIKRWTAAQAQCIVKSDSAFTAITYGLGYVESYGYNAGTLINNLNVIGSVHNSLDTSSHANLFTCPNTPAEISMLVSYKPTSMFWNLSAISALSPNTDLTDLNPRPVDSTIINGTTYYRYALTNTYHFTDTGTYQIPVRNTHPSIDNCNNSETVIFSVVVKANPKSDFTIAYTGCQLDTAQFNGIASSSNGYTINAWQWTFPDGSTSSIRDPHKLFATTGNQNVSLRVISAEGCVGDTIKTITTYAKPETRIGTAPAFVCEGGSISFSDTSTYGGPAPVNGWYWDFGNGTTNSVTANTPQSISFPNYGIYTVKHVARVSSVCVSDTVSRVIRVYAKPHPAFVYPAGCLPADGVVTFNNITTIPDGQTLTHAWNFGDASATSTNPNTSTLESPSHTYATGTYTVHYTATTEQGCTRDTTLSATFNIRPLLSYPALPALCASIQGTMSIAAAFVTNGVTGTGWYRGPATDSTGHFNPSVAGPGIYTVWYVFRTAGGCTDSISSSVRVYPKPQSEFSITPGVCLNRPVTITDHSTIVDGSVVRWNWDFGDGTNNAFTNGDAFDKSYASFGSYTVKLVAVSDHSCTSDTLAKTIAVHALPTAVFSLPTVVCMPEGQASFSTSASIADNSALSYAWNFGDGSSGSTATNPTHNFVSSGSYSVHLTVTSAFGCAKDSVQVLSNFSDRPHAQFQVSPDTLCQGANNVFSDESTAPGSTLQSWTWNFGDGSPTSALANPVKKYAQPGRFPVSLVVKNAAGCTSDAFHDTVIVYLQPVIDAGLSFIVTQGTPIRFHPTANDSTHLQFLWQPASDFSDPTVLSPALLATHNQTYTLTATGAGNCSASDELTVKILKPIDVPNSFSPNGDGINDTWNIPNLGDYPGCTVEVFNRYGQSVYQSGGYGTPWNGTYKGSSLPVATYYYVIKLKNGFAPLTGSVTIVK